MAAITAAVVVAAGSAYAANRQGAAAQRGADAQRDAANSANAESARQFDISRQDQLPWLEAGQGALSQMQALNSGDFSSFNASPDYQFTLDQGFKGLDRGAARGGNLWGGGADADRIALGQGLASQQYGNYYARLQSMAGQGQTTAGGLGALGANFANQYGNNLNNAADARASGYAAQGNAQAGYANALGSGLGAYFGANQWGGQAAQPAATSWGAFAPTTQPQSGGWSGSSAFGQWGQGWGG